MTHYERIWKEYHVFGKRSNRNYEGRNLKMVLHMDQAPEGYEYLGRSGGYNIDEAWAAWDKDHRIRWPNPAPRPEKVPA